MDEKCCPLNVAASRLEIGETYTISMKSLGLCYLRKFPKYSEEVSVTLKMTSSAASNPDGWLSKDVEIDFNNDETFACKNKDELVIDSGGSGEKSKSGLTLKCWNKVDKSLLGKNEFFRSFILAQLKFL